MKNNPAKKVILLALAFKIAGFIACASNPDFVPFGIALFGISVVLLINALVIVSKQIELREKQKEERMKQLADDVAYIKKHIKI